MRIPETGPLIVFLSAAIYWLGVCANAYYWKSKTGKLPRIKPRGLKERLLWLGWAGVVLAWLLVGWVGSAWSPRGGVFILGASLCVLGQALTYASYAALGAAWQISSQSGVTRLITRGPYRYLRHPIYTSQSMMLLGAAALVPGVFSIMLVLIHVVLVVIKSRDEERSLVQLFGSEASAYFDRTPRFVPFMRSL